MSEEVLQFIIGRAVTDPEFRELLFNNPVEALEGYELSEEETATLKEIERDRFEAGIGELEDRISRAGFVAADFKGIPTEGTRRIDLGGVRSTALWICP